MFAGPECNRNVWNLLRERLLETMPADLESREDFVKRLRNAANLLNKNHKDTMIGLGTNQHERANEVLANKGGRCKF